MRYLNRSKTFKLYHHLCQLSRFWSVRCTIKYPSRHKVSPYLHIVSRMYSSFIDDVTGISSTIRHSCQVALQRIIPLVPPFSGREAWRTQAPFIDTEIFTIHTMVHACSMYIHPEDYMDANDSWAFNSTLELISQLHEQDYLYIDPIIMVSTDP